MLFKSGVYLIANLREYLSILYFLGLSNALDLLAYLNHDSKKLFPQDSVSLTRFINWWLLYSIPCPSGELLAMTSSITLCMKAESYTEQQVGHNHCDTSNPVLLFIVLFFDIVTIFKMEWFQKSDTKVHIFYNSMRIKYPEWVNLYK